MEACMLPASFPPFLSLLFYTRLNINMQQSLLVLFPFPPLVLTH